MPSEANNMSIIPQKELYLRKVLLEQAYTPNGYLASLPVIQNLRKQQGLSFSAPVSFLVGENGTGKSTLLEAIAVACGFNPEGGGRNFQFHTAESHSSLSNGLRLWKGTTRPKDGYFLRAESFYNVASYLDELDSIPAGTPFLRDAYGGKSLHEMSHGESFLSLILNRFFGHGLYLLDEPEAALSPSRQMTLLARIHQLANMDSQFLIATHSPLLMACPGAQIFVLTEHGIEPTEYRKTEHYTLTRRFLENPERMLHYLLEEP